MTPPSTDGLRISEIVEQASRGEIGHLPQARAVPGHNAHRCARDATADAITSA